MAGEKEACPPGQGASLGLARGKGGGCRVCGSALRSQRERAGQACAYHLDVMKTPPDWNGR